MGRYIYRKQGSTSVQNQNNEERQNREGKNKTSGDRKISKGGRDMKYRGI